MGIHCRSTFRLYAHQASFSNSVQLQPAPPSWGSGAICWGQSTDQVLTLGINLRIYSGIAPTWNKCVTMSTSDSPPMTGIIVIKCTYKLPSVKCQGCHLQGVSGSIITPEMTHLIALRTKPMGPACPCALIKIRSRYADRITP